MSDFLLGQSTQEVSLLDQHCAPKWFHPINSSIPLSKKAFLRHRGAATNGCVFFEGSLIGGLN